MFDWLADPNAWIALATLTALEIVLGVDNIIFISILVGRLPPDKRDLARRLGLSLAMGTRILLLLSLAWIMRLTEPLFTLIGKGFSGRDLILLGGGLFLLWKSVHEVHGSLEGDEHGEEVGAAKAAGVSFVGVVVQIAIIDIVFSLDSVITAVGMVDELAVMVAAVVIAVALMMVAAGPISTFVDRHPTVKMLALSFLLLIGLSLLLEGFDQHIPKGYVYFAMAFSVFVEMINLWVRHKAHTPPVTLRKPIA
jgi:predicted tellurium resistance membrane protein TerC